MIERSRQSSKELITCMSWNVLNQDYMQKHTQKSVHLSFSARVQKIAAYIWRQATDIVCLQELSNEMFNALRPLLQNNTTTSYTGVWIGQSTVDSDGCAILWNNTRFKRTWIIDPVSKEVKPLLIGPGHNVENFSTSEYVGSIIRSWNQFVMCVSLLDVNNGKYVFVNTTHLHWNFRKPWLQTLQAYMALKWIASVILENRQLAPYVILAGDFNSTPGSSSHTSAQTYPNHSIHSFAVQDFLRYRIPRVVLVSVLWSDVVKTYREEVKSAMHQYSFDASGVRNSAQRTSAQRTSALRDSELRKSVVHTSAVPTSAMPHYVDDKPVLPELKRQEQAKVSAGASGVYQLITTGSVEPDHNHHPNHIQGGQFHSESLQSAVHFASAYFEIMGVEPEITTSTKQFSGTLDYIFYLSNEQRLGASPLKVVRVLPLLDKSIGVLPNEWFPSDHLYLVAEFKYENQKNKYILYLSCLTFAF